MLNEDQELEALRTQSARLDTMVRSLREQLADAGMRAASVEADMAMSYRQLAAELAALKASVEPPPEPSPV